jgi:hypothetical protein
MTILRRGDTGPEVERLEHWLSGQFPGLVIGGEFDARTEIAVKTLQGRAGLKVDGIAGPITLAHFERMGFRLAPTELPPKPSFAPLSSADRQRVWGAIVGVPLADGSSIRITNGWKEAVQVTVPQLFAIPGANKGRVWWHREGVQSLLGFWRDVEAAGKLGCVLSWAGSWAPRFVRGSRSTLSSHAHATAFDINAQWNGLGATPATGHGSVFELVPIAHRWGFYWGGHFSRPDGMHFEMTRADG